ncbi:hypothetical protein E4U42_004541 [Claviceps africana]|uniref:Uncharacterized protein n=1 Tax=Claviceps africana TaxID=83212 RepID=A0A8K0J551_9HYPO|nr:hypothetical protein E4U42_004541 [Claviceps africana]
MSLRSSPQQIVQAQLGRRFAIVPKDQLRILDHDGAWAVDPKDRQGVPQVPDHVLNDIASHHFVQLQAARQAADRLSFTTQDLVSNDHNSRQGVEDEDEDEDDEAGVGHDEAGSGRDNSNGDGSQEQEDQDEDDGTLISEWSPSPIRQRFHPISASGIPQFQTQVGQPMPHVNQLDLDSSLSQDAVPMPAPAQTPLCHVDTLDEDEDDEHEEEMEVDLPGARESSQTRVNLEAARIKMMFSTPAATTATQVTTNETPSCAQPDERFIISGTVLAGRSPDGHEKEPQQRRHRRMRPILFEGTTPIKRVKNSLSVIRLPSTSRLADVDSSMSTSSSSLIPATCATASTQKSTAGDAAAIHIPAAEHTSPSNTLPQAHDVASKQRSSIESPSRQTEQDTCRPKNIYSLFTSTYPSYTAHHAGTLKNFVKALLCLEYLQSERGLHEFLYDDFIRAFSGAYLHYVRNAGPGQEALPAIEWFNMRDGQPEFSQMIITKRNLHAALGEFPEEVSLARRFIGGRPQEEKGVPRETKQRDVGASAELDRNACQTREKPLSAAANHAPAATAPSSHLGSDAHDVSRGPPASSARVLRTPTASHYFERMKSESRNRSARPGSVDHQARLREHFRKTAAKRAKMSGSRHGSAQ